MVELDSIGAGAGTAVRVDRFKRVQLGPDSAGSDVGICFRYPELTISDLNVALGFLNPLNFLGGSIRLDRQAALEAIEERLARPLGVDVNRAAEGVLDVLHGQMRDAIRNTLLARGYSPADYTLFAYGGAGPLHLRGIADGGFRGVATFPWAAAFSAFGVACCSIARRYSAGVSAYVHPGWDTATKAGTSRQFSAVFRRLEDQARREMKAAGIQESDIRFRYAMFARYMGHLEPLEVPLTSGAFATAADVDAALAAFESTYVKIYTEAGRFPEAGYFVSEFILEAIAPKPSPEIPEYDEAREVPDPDALKGGRKVYFGRWVQARIFEMDRLRAGNRIKGPAIIEDPMTTLVVPPGRQVQFDRHRVIWYGEAR
jgi:N-methylhydantoinase A